MRNLEGLLACPDCRSALSIRDGVLDPCPGCRRTFEIVGGSPILHPNHGRDTDRAGRQFFIEEPGRLDKLRRDHPRLGRTRARSHRTSRARGEDRERLAAIEPAHPFTPP